LRRQYLWIGAQRLGDKFIELRGSEQRPPIPRYILLLEKTLRRIELKLWR
jgi:hypothetical protein